jgi:tetratricopeptide (TPR) repeat protein
VITFADVGGMEGVKTRIERAFLAPLRNPEIYRSFGREIRGGLVLFGPPGCRWDVAIAEAGHAIAADPTAAEAHALLAQALHGNGQHEQALLVVQGGMAIAPDHEWLHRLRARVLLDLGRPHDALAAVDEAIRIGPLVANGHGLRAQVLDSLEDQGAAREACLRALALSPREAWLHQVLGHIELHSADAPAAERAYRAALSYDPTSAVALNNLGVALERQGRDDEALLAFKAAVLADPTFVLAKRNTHGAIKSATAVAGVAGAASIGLGKSCVATGGIAQAVRGRDVGVVLAVLVLAVAAVTVGILLARALKKARVQARLKRLDPGLWSLFERLDRDHRQGRL